MRFDLGDALPVSLALEKHIRSPTVDGQGGGAGGFNDLSHLDRVDATSRASQADLGCDGCRAAGIYHALDDGGHAFRVLEQVGTAASVFRHSPDRATEIDVHDANVVFPGQMGAYLGQWLDEKLGGDSAFWTVSLILTGVVIGIVNVYLLIRESS